ncbi:MAG TPA: hypothetical protein VFK10_10995 [Burkholderiaceae bacterium]|nr:hypothetical protein [Burkholderiaceae bacterium]
MPNNTPIRRRLAACLGTALSLLITGCATPIPDGDPGQPLTVRLPLRSAHIVDGRAAFAAAFQRELDASTTLSNKDAAAYLRIAAPAGSAATASVPSDLRRTSVLLVPGLFGDCVDTQAVPFGDGVVRPRDDSYTQAYRIYDDLGLAGIRAMKVPGRASSTANGEIVARELLAEAGRTDVDRIVLIGYSKGVPDMLEGLARLQQQRQVPAKLQAVVSMAGVVMGTPLADRFGALYDAVSGAMEVAGCPPSTGGEVQSMMRPVRRAWLADAVLPTSPRYYSIVGQAERDDVALALRGFFDRLSAYDLRTDGQVLLPDAILPDSTLLAVANSDHWNFVLPFARSPRRIVQAQLASGRDFPREALLRAIVRTVTASPR